jgi:hypothetical protein
MTRKRPSPPDGPEHPDGTPIRIIVRRGALRRFDALTRKSVDLPIAVEWDRRLADRRTSPAGAGTERRGPDRRQTPPFTWDLADFVVAAPEGDARGRDETSATALADWRALEHAFGTAEDVPALLAAAARDRRQGHDEGSAWFVLWSALWHEGDAYSASLAAVPHLIRMAPEQLALQHYDALLLAASIELARLEGRAPGMPDGLQADYAAALEAGLALAEHMLPNAWDEGADAALRGSVAVFRGDVTSARAIFDPEDTRQDETT